MRDKIVDEGGDSISIGFLARQTDNLIFGAMQALFGAGIGVLFVFIVGYMKAQGYAAVEIGYVRAAAAAASIVGSLLWGAVADKSRRIGVMVGVMTVAGVALAPLFRASGGAFWPLLALFSLASFFLIPIQVLVDSWTTAVAQQNPSVSFGVTRAMGSLGFALALLFAGRFFDAFGIEHIFLVYSLLLLPLLLCVLIAGQRHKGSRQPQAAAGGTTAAGDRTRTRTLNRPLIAFLVICSLMMICFIASFNFMPLLMSELGGSHRHVGSASAVMALSEIPFMIFSAALLRRFRDSKVIGVACLFFALRVGSHLVFRTPEGLVAGHVLQGFSFGLFIPAAVSLCARVSRPSHRTRVLALLDIVVFGAGDVISSIIGGWLISLYGVRGMYTVISVIVWIPVVWYCRRFVFHKQHTPRGRP